MRNICKVDHCNRYVTSFGYCRKHHLRNQKHGDPEAGPYGPGEAVEHLRRIAKSKNTLCVSLRNHDINGWYKSVYYKGRYTKAHRLMTIFAHGNPPTKTSVAMHLCNNKGCVNPRHLFWGEPQDNSDHASECGLIQKGESQWRSMLSNSDVLRIRDRYKNGESCSEIAKDYPVEKSNIWAVATGHTWKHVGGLK